MSRYIIRRLLLIIPGVFLVGTLAFAMVRMLPGDAVDFALEAFGAGNPEFAQFMRERLGLDKPVYVQFFIWWGRVLTGDFGTSFHSHQEIIKEAPQRIAITLELGALAMFFAAIIAVPIGFYSALRQDTFGDYAGRVFAIAAMAIPTFWLGVMVVVIPSLLWGWMPPFQFASLTEDPSAHLQQFLIPAVIIALHVAGSIMRVTRTSVLEVMRQDYIRTAWAKGLRERAIIAVHVAKNSMIPVITMFGTRLHLLIGGSVVIENIFGLPGMGRWVLMAVNVRDYPVVQAINLFYAVVIMMANIIVDITYAYFDPRVRYA